MSKGNDAIKPSNSQEQLDQGKDFIAMNIVNQLGDLWNVPVGVRQATNNKADRFVADLITQATEKAEQAYGGCRNCYGKGYSTWRHGETYQGRTTKIRNDMKFCDCVRGKQLEALITKALAELEATK